MIVYSTRNHGIISHIYTHPSIHPSTLTPPNQQKKLHQTHHLLKGTSSILVVRLLSPHIPIMAHSIPSHSRGVRSRGSLIPMLTGAFPYAAALPYLLIGGSPPTAVVSVAKLVRMSAGVACVGSVSAFLSA